MADAPLIAVLGAIGGSLVTGVASLGGLLHQSRSQGDREHRQRAFERHLAQYERIFATARSAHDAFQDLGAVYEDVHDPADPFLGQILAVTADRADDFCLAVDWKHNPAMAYLDLKLEERCLYARRLLLDWLSTPRMTVGDIAYLRKPGAEENDLLQMPLNDRTLPAPTAAYLAAHVTGNTELYGIGDQGVAALRTAFAASRIGAVAGPDRYATAAAVARTFFTGPTTPHTLGLAVGSNWPDALAGGALLGAHTGPLLLADGASLPGVEGDCAAATASAVDEVLAFGGTDVVPDSAAFAVGHLVSVPGQRSFFVNRTAPFLP